MVEGPIVDLEGLEDFRIGTVVDWVVRRSRTMAQGAVQFQDTVAVVVAVAADLGNYSLDLDLDLDLDLGYGPVRAMKNENR